MKEYLGNGTEPHRTRYHGVSSGIIAKLCISRVEMNRLLVCCWAKAQPELLIRCILMDVIHRLWDRQS